MSLEELSEELITILRSKEISKEDRLNKVIRFLENHSQNAKEIIGTIVKNVTVTPLNMACLSSQEAVVKLFLLTYKADPNARDGFSNTALLSILNKFIINETGLSIIRILAENGADLNALVLDESPLMFATYPAFSKNVKLNSLVDLLIELGADVNKTNSKGQTPLIFAAKEDAKREIPSLIRSGADLNAQDDCGRTALMYCVMKNNQMANDLIEAKANVFIKDQECNTAIDFLDFCKEETNSRTIIPKLARAYLEPLSSYFKTSSYEQIQSDIDKFLKNPNDELFPVKLYHLSAIRRLNLIFYDDFEMIFKKFANDFEYLLYFDSSDFVEKLYADVINRINQDDAEIDGQTLKGMRSRAKSEEDLSRLNEITDILKDKSKLASDFLIEAKKVIESLKRSVKNLPIDFLSSDIWKTL